MKTLCVALALLSVGAVSGIQEKTPTEKPPLPPGYYDVDACKGRVVVEWTNQRQEDLLVSQLLAKAEGKARRDGYCVDHLDLYDSLGTINSRATYALKREIKDSPVAIFEVRSIPITKNRSIVASQMRWQRGYGASVLVVLGTSVLTEDFDVVDFDAALMNAPEPLGYVGYVDRIENAADLTKGFFNEGK